MTVERTGWGKVSGSLALAVDEWIVEAQGGWRNGFPLSRE